MVKVTFTLDDDTVRLIRRLAERRKKPQSAIVREAVAAYAGQEQKLSEADRKRKLEVLDQLLQQPPTRPQAEVETELVALRNARRSGWRRDRE